MKILMKGFTHDEFAVQLEDWSEDYPTYRYKFDIGAYPKESWKKRFRAQCEFKNKDEALEVFEALLSGKKTVFDFNFTVAVPGGNRIHIKETNLKRVTD